MPEESQLDLPIDVLNQECRSCHELKPNTSEYFVTRHKKPDTLCRACHRLRTQAWRKAHPAAAKPSPTPESRAKAKEYQRKWREAHPGYYMTWFRRERAMKRTQEKATTCPTI